MAPFNPEPKEVGVPDLRSYTRPVEGPEATGAMGKALASAGEAVKAFGEGVDKTFKSYISDTLFSQIDKERTDYTNALRIGKADASGAARAEDLLPADKTLPPSVQGLRPAVDNLESARANGAISETYYYQRLATIAKDMRQRFPGYRDYIDKQVSEVTGVDPANAYIKSVIGDINSYLTKKNTDVEKTETLFRENTGIPGIDKVYQDWRSGKISNIDVYTHISDWKQVDTKITRAKNQLSLTEDQNKGAASVAKGSATVIANQLASQYYVSQFMGKSPKDVAQWIDDVNTGKVKLDTVQAQQYAQVLAGMRAAAEASMDSHFNQPLNSDNPAINGKTLNELGTPEEIAKIKKSALSLYDTNIDRLTNQSVGLIHTNANIARAVTSDDTIAVYKDKDVGDSTRIMGVLDKVAPSIQSTLLKETIAAQIPNKWAAYYQTAGAHLTTQPDFKTLGEVATPAKVIDEAEKKAKAKGVEVPQGLPRAVINIPTKVLLDPKVSDNEKIETARGAYAIENQRVFDKFDKQNRISVFNTMYSPEVTKEMRRLGNIDAKVWNDYRSSAEFAFGTKILTTEVKDLSNIQKNPDIKIAWDKDDKRFVPIIKPGINAPADSMYGTFNPYTPVSNDQIAYVKATIDRINNGLVPFKSIAEASGMNIESYIARQLMANGFEPSLDPNGNVANEIFQSMIDSRAKVPTTPAPKKRPRTPNLTE